MGIKSEAVRKRVMGKKTVRKRYSKRKNRN